MSPAAVSSLFMFFLIIAVVGLLALRNRILFKLGLNNVLRRKVNTVLIVMGLMIGTAIISGSFIVGDTLENLFTKGVYDSYDETDEIAFTFTPNGTYAFFNMSIYDSLKVQISGDERLSSLIDGMSPEITVSASAFSLRTKLAAPGLRMIGVDMNESQGFGPFYPTTGGRYRMEDLGPNQMIMTDRAAEEMDVKAGDTLLVYMGNANATFLEVKHVVEFRGRAAYGQMFGLGGLNMFMRLEHVQSILNVSDSINLIKISNKGDKYDGLDHSEEVSGELAPFLRGQDPPLFISEAKAEAIEFAEEGSSSLRDLFLILGTFSIIAGIMLVINIFVMLAEERKGEMGISRAIGMKRKHLMYSFLFEGTLLAVFAAVIGAFVGVMVAYVIILAFSNIWIGSDFPIMEYFTFSTDSLVISFSMGLMITFLTIVYASWKVSKLNIIRAIRNIPEPRYQRAEARSLEKGLSTREKLGVLKDHFLRQYELIIIFGGIFLTIGFFMLEGSPMHGEQWSGYGGLSFYLLGLTLLLRRWITDERAFTIGGSLILLLWAYPYDFYEIVFGYESHGEMEMFIMSGLFMIMASLFIIIYNNDFILGGLIRIFGRFRSVVPVFKTAISYPMASKFRTGMTLAMFSLIIFTITTTAMIMGQIEGNIDQLTFEQSGGYDMIGYTSPWTPFQDFEAEMTANETLRPHLDDFERIVPLPTAFSAVYTVSSDLPEKDIKGAVADNRSKPFQELADNGTLYNLVGCSEKFFEYNQYELHSWDSDNFRKESDVWKAISDNHSLAVIDATVIPQEFGPPVEGELISIGDWLVVKDSYGHDHGVRIIGIMKQSLIQGIFVNSTVLEDRFETSSASLILFKFRSGISDAEQERIAKRIEAGFVDHSMQTFLIKKEIEASLEQLKNFFWLLQGFIGLGLVVGIAGLGIITIRSVTERRQQIGMLRAIGFKRSMILKSFLIESSFIALLGIFLGVGLGIILGYRIFLEFETATFLIPWDTIILVSLLSYVFTFLSTFGPSRSASKVTPAEALRYLG